MLGYAERWDIPKATVGRFLKRMETAGYLSLMSFPGTHGSVIYLQNYLSTMFRISDVMIDKDEVAMVLNIKILLPEKVCDEPASEENKETGSVSKNSPSVSKAAMETLVEKAAQILSTQGFSCFDCPKSTYKLYPLSADDPMGLADRRI